MLTVVTGQSTVRHLLASHLACNYANFKEVEDMVVKDILFLESGQPREPLDREFLCRELKMNPDHTTKSL